MPIAKDFCPAVARVASALIESRGVEYHRAHMPLPQGMTQFPERAAGVSGYYATDCNEQGCDGLARFEYSIVDKVVVLASIELGEWLFARRWDCVQSRQ